MFGIKAIKRKMFVLESDVVRIRTILRERDEQEAERRREDQLRDAGCLDPKLGAKLLKENDAMINYWMYYHGQKTGSSIDWLKQTHPCLWPPDKVTKK